MPVRTAWRYCRMLAASAALRALARSSPGAPVEQRDADGRPAAQQPGWPRHAAIEGAHRTDRTHQSELRREIGDRDAERAGLHDDVLFGLHDRRSQPQQVRRHHTQRPSWRRRQGRGFGQRRVGLAPATQQGELLQRGADVAFEWCQSGGDLIGGIARAVHVQVACQPGIPADFNQPKQPVRGGKVRRQQSLALLIGTQANVVARHFGNQAHPCRSLLGHGRSNRARGQFAGRAVAPEQRQGPRRAQPRLVRGEGIPTDDQGLRACDGSGNAGGQHDGAELAVAESRPPCTLAPAVAPAAARPGSPAGWRVPPPPGWPPRAA